MKNTFQYELDLVNVVYNGRIVNFLSIYMVSCASVFSVPILLKVVLTADFSLVVQAVCQTNAYFAYDYTAFVSLSLLSSFK